MTRLFTLLFLLLSVSFSIAQGPSGWQEKIDSRLLEKIRSSEELDFILMLRQQADVQATARQLLTKEDKAWYVFESLREQAEKTQAPLISRLQQAGVFYQSFFIVNAIRIKGNADLLMALAASPIVQKAIDNSPLRIEEPLRESELEFRGPTQLEWGLDMINADEVWNLGIRGQGVVVGGQDTGYDWDHPALIEMYRGWDGNVADHNYNWHDAIHQINPLNNDSIIDPSNNPCGLDVPYPCDDHSHGTHTMGTMVGEEGDNLIGVAPEARWIGCRNMERGWGNPSSYIECFEWFMAPTDLNDENPDPSKAPHVIANSWSCPEIEGCNPDNFAIMETAVNNLKASGVVVVVSAGNSGSQGCGSVNTPAAIFENSFSVGATAKNDTITGFSSRGPVLVDGSNRLKPDVSAPGRLVRSSIPGDGYATFSGTSMAGPHVAGAVALIISANPDLAGQVDMIEDILEQTAVPKQTEQNCGGISGLAIPNNTYGYGRIDALAAVQEALNLISDTEEIPGHISVTAFPNPFQSTLTIETQSLESKVQFSLLDVNGRVLLQENWQVQPGFARSWELAELPAGMYFYQLRHEGGQIQGKLIKH